MATPKAGWTHTDDVVKWAEEFANFLTREKTQAQKCLHDCERLLNDPSTKSDSLKDGLRDLMSKTEDNFGTLLHLERVLNMKNLGDSSASPTKPAVTPSNNHANQIKQTGRFRQHRVRSAEAEDSFDPLKDDLLFADSHEAQNTSREETDDFDEDSGFPEAAYKRHDIEKPLMMAKSLPMNVPMPDLRRAFMGRSPPDVSEDTQDIPTKIAELAKSLHGEAIGELPSPRYID